MYVVIAGGGRIGRHIARDMERNRHEVTVVEMDARRCEQLVTDTSVLVIEGDAGDVRYLEQAYVDRADVFVATTHEDETNLVACQLARAEFGVTRCIARVNSPKNVEIFETLGIEPVSSTRLISELIENEFSVGELIHLTTLKGGRVSLVEVRIPENGPAARPVQSLALPAASILVVLFRGDETIIPRGDTMVLPGDEVVALTVPSHEDALRKLLVEG